MSSTHPTVGDSAITEREAVALVTSLLPASWLPRRQDPDYYVDYNVEVVQDGELTGLQFAIQVKGSRRVNVRKGIIRFRMERKPLQYYRDCARLPVFLVVADVDEKRAYWLFAQQYLREHAGTAQLESKNTLTVTLDVRDCFSDISRFKEAVRNAETYMRELYPGSVIAAVDKRRQSLQRLDPNIGVSVSVQYGREVLQLYPSTPLSFTFVSREIETRERFHSMVRQGDVFLADMELLGPLDSPLMRELMPVGRYRLRFEPESRPGSVQLRWGQDPRLLHIDGFWRGGIDTMRFNGSLPRCPLSVEITVDRGANENDFNISVSTPLQLDEWEGQPVSQLSWFDELRGLVSTLATEQEVALTYFIEGTRVGCGGLTATNSEININIHRELDWLERVRFSANHYGVNPPLPKPTGITYQTERELDALWALTRGDSFQDEISGATFGCSVDSEGPLPPHWKSGESQVHGTMKIIGTAPFSLFGHVIEIPNVENIMTDVELISFEDASPPSKRRLNFRGGDSAIWLRRRLNSPPTSEAVVVTPYRGSAEGKAQIIGSSQ